MATKRKYKVPGYRDGGRVPLSAGAAGPAEVELEETGSAEAPPLPPPADDPIQKALEAQRRAEEMQRQQPQTTAGQYIDAMPISAAKKEWLRQRPEMLRPDYAEVMREAHEAWLQHGADDTPAMFEYLSATVSQEMQARRQRLADAARAAAATMAQPPRPELSVEREVERLDAEANGYMAAQRAREAIPAALAAQMPQPEPAPRAPRMPMSAPVSRDVPSVSGQRVSSPSQVTLTAEERFIARNSFTDPTMSNAEKEQLYAQQKARLASLRSQGLYPQPERG